MIQRERRCERLTNAAWCEPVMNLLLTTTLRDAMNELKRYRKPSDTITVVRGLLGCKEPVDNPRWIVRSLLTPDWNPY